MNLQTLTLSTLAFAFGVLPAAAQEMETLPKAKAERLRQDISLFLQYAGPVSSTNSSIQGILYRQQLRSHPQVFWKGGFGSGTASRFFGGQQTDTLAPDLAVNISREYRERIYILTAGAETERPLWRGIYFTAGAEVQAGVTGGGVDSIAYEYGIPPPGGVRTDAGKETKTRIADTRSYFGSSVLSLGLRGYFGRFTVAGEGFMWLRAGISHQEIKSGAFPPYTLLDIDFGRNGLRLSAGYRF